MNRFWGRNDDVKPQKFARDDEQILSLNYENLCDSDYLSRIFVCDAESTDSPPVMSAQAENKLPSSLIEEYWSLTPDLAEDILLFGDDEGLGRDFLQKRLLKEISSTIKYQDVLSILVHRQVDVFEHIANIISAKSTKLAEAVRNVAKNVISSSQDGCKHLRCFVSDTLQCALRVMERQSRQRIKHSGVEPLLSLIINSLCEAGGKSDMELKIKKPDGVMMLPSTIAFLRSILCNGMIQKFEPTGKMDPKKSEDLLRLSLCSSYGLLVLGMYMGDSGDVLMAICHLIAVILKTDEWQDELSGTGLTALQHSHVMEMNIISATHEKDKDCQKKMKFKLKATDSNAYNPVNLKLVGNNSNILGNPNPKLSHLSNILPVSPDAALRESARYEDNPKFSVGKKWGRQSNPVTNMAKLPLEKVDKDAKTGKHAMVKNRSVVMRSACLVTNPTAVNPAFDEKDMKEVVVLPKMLPTKPAIPASLGASPAISSHSKKKPSASQPAQPSITNQQLRNELDSKVLLQNLLRVPKGVVKVLKDKLAVGSANSSAESPFAVAKSTSSASSHEQYLKSYVWTCGQNSYGELGHGDVNQRKSFTKVTYFDGKSVVSVGAGNEHSAFVTKQGKLFVSGYNDNGQCGTGTTQQVRQLCPVVALEGEEIVDVHIYNGCEHSLVVTKDGKLYSFGYNYRGQLGHGNTNSESTPRPIKSLLSRKVAFAACSYHHSFIYCLDGSLFSCGRNDCGQLGHGDQIDKKSPQLVVNAPKDIRSLSCGQFHSVIATHGGAAYVCGKNDYGQLGFEGPENMKTMTKVHRSAHDDEESVIQVCCGYYHTLLLLQNGAVIGFGRNDYGQLGLGHTIAKVNSCQLISGLNDKNVTAISAGCYHSVAVTSNGMIYVFGRNNHGQLGTGDLDERHAPHPVDNFVGKRIVGVAAGFYHTIVLAMDTAALDGDEAEMEQQVSSSRRKQDRLADSLSEMLLNTATAPLLGSTSSMGNRLTGFSEQNQKGPSSSNFGSGKLTLVNPAAAGTTGAHSVDYATVLAGVMSASSPSSASQHKGSSNHAASGSDNQATESRTSAAAAGYRGFSLDSRSKISVKEILVVLVRQLEWMVAHPTAGLMATQANEKTADGLGGCRKSGSDTKVLTQLGQAGCSDISWVIRQLRAVAALLEIARGSFVAQVESEAPMGAEDALCFMKTLVRLAESLLKQHGAALHQACEWGEQDAAGADGADTSDERDNAEGIAGIFSDFVSRPFKEIAATIMSEVHCQASEVFEIQDDEVLSTALKESTADNARRHESEGSQLDADKASSSRSNSGSSNSTGPASLRKALAVRTALAKVRREILLGYFFAPEAAVNERREALDETVVDCSTCISRCFDTLFPTPAQRSQLFNLLGNQLTQSSVCDGFGEERSPSPQEAGMRQSLSLHYDRCLRLFTRLCFKYREIGSVMKLFQASKHQGLVVFRQLLSVYNKLSMIGLGRKLQQSSLRAGDIFRASGTLEHCCSNFVKCAIPVIFEAISNGQVESGSVGPRSRSGSLEDLDKSTSTDKVDLSAFGSVIIREVFEDAEAVLDFVSQPHLLDLSANVFRHGTVIPSILPTTLLYCMSYSKRCAFALEMLPIVRSLVKKLFAANGNRLLDSTFSLVGSPQAAGKTMVSPAVDRKGRTGRGVANNASYADNAAHQAAGMGDEASHADGAQSKSDSTPTKKDLLQASWWSRLVKISTILSAKLAATLIHSPQLPQASTAGTGTGTVAAAGASPDSQQSQLQRHPAWQYLAGPEDCDHLGLADLTITRSRDEYEPWLARIHVLLPPEIVQACADLRLRQMKSDHMYRVLYGSVRARKTAAAAELAGGSINGTSEANIQVCLENIEAMIFDTVMHVEGYDSLMLLMSHVDAAGREKTTSKVSKVSAVWTAIANTIKLFHSKRSSLLASADATTWGDALYVIFRVVQEMRSFVQCCTPRFRSSVPLLPGATSHPSRPSQSAAKRAFRRTVLAIICVARWKACYYLRAGALGPAVVHLITATIENVTGSFTDISRQAVADMWSGVMRGLKTASEDIAKFSQGVAVFTELLRDTSYFSMKADVVLMLSEAWQDRATAERNILTASAVGPATAMASSSSFCSSEVSQSLHFALVQLLEQMRGITHDFLQYRKVGMTGASVNEISLLTLVTKFLHLSCSVEIPTITSCDTSMYNIWLGRICGAGWGSYLAEIQQLVVLLDDRSSEATAADDKLQAPKKMNPRERNKALKRAANALIYWIQALSMKETAVALDCKPFVSNRLMLVHCELFAHLQRARMAVARNNSDLDVSGSFKSSGGDLAAGIAAGKGMKDAGKRRCQDLITKPIEFSRTQEGFVIQGDKLLNNFKGTDFTLATWVFVAKKTNAKNSFITGKVSHNDAWPLVILRSDLKINVLFGHGNDFETLTSQSTVTPQTWVHIAVVVEAKKIKLFINGAQDCQANTKGNTRAIMYPVVVGSCPQGVRTRVDQVREGMDGMLAQYKYYTRGLSPIHVRVVFDQGPPESYDARERWIYQLLVSFDALVGRRQALATAPAVSFTSGAEGLTAPPSAEASDAIILTKAAEVLHMLFVTDAGSRLRLGALQILKKVLMTGCLSDLVLSANNGYVVNGSYTCNGVSAAFGTTVDVNVLTCSFLSEHTSLEDRLVMYFLRMLGACWSPTLLSVTEDMLTDGTDFMTIVQQQMRPQPKLPQQIIEFDNELSSLRDFLNHVPSFMSFKNHRANSSVLYTPITSNTALDAQAAREEQIAELSHHIMHLLRSLSTQKVWKESISRVLGFVLNKGREVVDVGHMGDGGDCPSSGAQAAASAAVRSRPSSRSSSSGRNGAWTILPSVDLLGAAILLGERISNPCVGSDVASYYGDNQGRIMNIHKNNTHLTLLSWNNSGSRRQLSVVRVGDVSPVIAAQKLAVEDSLVPYVLDTMESLRRHVQLLATDLMCIYRPDHPFQRQSLLRIFRPVEVFVFHQLLRCVLDHKTTFLPETIRSRPELFKMVQQTSVHALRVQSKDDDDTTERSVPALWMKSARCVAALMGGVIVNEFPPPESERSLIDFVAKGLGIAVDTFQQTSFEKFLKLGMFSELIHCVPSGSSNLNTHESPWATVSSSPVTSAASALAAAAAAGADEANRVAEVHSGVSHMFPMNDWLSAAADGTSLNIFGSAPGEYDVAATGALRALFLLRHTVVRGCQELVAGLFNDLPAFTELPTASKTLLWQGLLSHASGSTSLANYRAIGAGTVPGVYNSELSMTESVSDDILISVSQMCRALHDNNRSEVTHALASSLRFSAISLLQMNSSKCSSNVLEATNLLSRLFQVAKIWLQYHEGDVMECDLCYYMLKMLLPTLSFVESSDIELQMMVLCRAALQRLVQRLMAGHAATKELLDLSKSNNFTLLRARAQEQLIRQKGTARYQFSPLAQNLTQLAAGLEIIQRVGNSNSSSGTGNGSSSGPVGSASETPRSRSSSRSSSISMSGGSRPNSPRAASAAAIATTAAAASVLTSRPAIVGVRQTSVDADLIPCAMAAVNAAAAFATSRAEASSCNSDALSTQGSSGASGTEASVAGGTLSMPSLKPMASSLSLGSASSIEGVLVEVAIAVAMEGEESVFETVYSGSSLRFVQSGLSPGCSYKIRCRASICSPAAGSAGTFTLDWSQPVEFHTDAGVSFAFDSLKCGPDVLLSDDGLTASYAGDDSWSTALGTQSFSSGITSWKIRIQQSSTAYIFIGVAAGQADLTTFLGGCSNGWGFIGEQAVYNNREKVKVYGEAFGSGDIIGVILDLNAGTLSFTRNGKSLGVAFDKIYGELYPAVAFYNVGQELEILVDGFQTTCPQEPIPCSPSRINIDEISLLNELIFCVNSKSPLSPRILSIVADHLNDWCGAAQVRCKTIAGKYIFLSKAPALLQRFGLVVGERVRTPYGVAEVVGCAYNRVWFVMNASGAVWFFSNQQITKGREKGFFVRCSYEVSAQRQQLEKSGGSLSSVGGGEALAAAVESPFEIGANGISPSKSGRALYDAGSLQDMLLPESWSDEMDAALVAFLMKKADDCNGSPWVVSANTVNDEFRSLQQQLTRLVMNSVELSHRWGISGPKRRAVVARMGLLRMMNHLVDFHIPAMMIDVDAESVVLPGQPADDFNATIITLPKRNVTQPEGDDAVVRFKDLVASTAHTVNDAHNGSADEHFRFSDILISPSWAPASANKLLTQGPLPMTRNRIFTELKLAYFNGILAQSAARPAKTDDDYDYPEDLPQVKLNRFKSFRAREASELIGISGEDMLQSSMFFQLWRELGRQAPDKLRISYTHPMDDGQARAFKVRFEGEGVDDYGGPYREVFQQICDEIQRPDPSLSPSPRSSSGSREGDPFASSHREERAQELNGNMTAMRCFVPLLHPTPNWTAGECEERYRFTFYPGGLSTLRLELYRFLGQFVAIAIRSRITLDLALPSFIWKCVVREPLSEMDIASFDAPAAGLVQQLSALLKRVRSEEQESNVDAKELLQAEIEAYIQDLTWTARRCDGRVVELVPGGSERPVQAVELAEFLQAYVACRLRESSPAIEAFREGVLSVIPESALALLCWQDIERVVCGSTTIDIERLKQNTEYDDDVSATDPHIVAFWEVLSTFTEAEKGAFLRFVWARPTLPPKGVDFPQKFKVQSAVGDDATLKPDQYLPKAHTCFFSVNLPRYSSKELMEEKLRYAITNCTEMDADYKLTDTDVAGWGVSLAQP